MKTRTAPAESSARKGKTSQRGVALLIMLVIAVMGSLFAVTGQLEYVSRNYARNEATRKALVLAKEALIGYALTYRDDPTHSTEAFGYLPCPDSTGDGVADTNDGTNCSNSADGKAAIGLLPYQTLGLPDLRDSDGICLWYAVSGNFKAALTKYAPMNWDTQGQFSIQDGSGNVLIQPGDAYGGAAAVIFAAGPPLTGQSRSVNGSYPCQIVPSEVSAYLDGNYNFATSSNVTITQGSSGSDSNNDQLAWITPKEIFDKVVSRADFGNALSATPPGLINTLNDKIQADLELRIQNDLVNGTTTSTPQDNFSGVSSVSVGSLTLSPTLSSTLASTYANDLSNWQEQYRLVTCSPLTACLTIGGSLCQGALMFGGRSSTANGYTLNGQPRPTADKAVSSAFLGKYFESGGGLGLLNGTSASFSGNTAFSSASPSADVGICLTPGSVGSFAQNIGSYFAKTTSAVRPEAAIDVAAQTITLGNTTATASGSGCVWYPTQLSFNSSLRAYFVVNIANLGEGFIYAILDGTNNQTAMTNHTLCGSTTGALLGYSSATLAYPKFALEIDTRVPASQTTSPCGATARDDPSANHMAFVYWGSTASATDDNCHGSTAGTLGSGSQPLNPRTLSTSSTTPATTVATVGGFSWSGNVATVTTTAAHGQSSNQQVTVSGMIPTSNNGTYQVAVVDTTHLAYSLAPNVASAARLTYSVTAASWSGGSATLATATAHGLSVGSQVTVSGVTPAGYNGSYTVASVSDATHFTFVLASDPGSFVSGGTVYAGVSIATGAAHGLSVGDQVTLSGIYPAGYAGSFTVASLTDSTHFTCWLTDPGVITTVAAASWSGSVASVTTDAAHGLVAGNPVTISGITPAAYNGAYAVASVIDATHFTYSLSSDPGSYASGGSLDSSGGNVYSRGGTIKTYAGIKNVQASDTYLPYAGTMPTATDIYVRLDVDKSYDATLIQAASWSSGTVTVTTAAAHGLKSSQQVTVSSSTPSGYNGTYAVSVTDTTHFTYALAADPGTYSSGGMIRPVLGATVSAASRTAAGVAWTATITTASAHGFVSGQPVSLSGISPAAYNGTYQIVVEDATHFTYALGADPGAYVSGGSLTAAVALTLRAYVASNFPSCTSSDFQNLSRDLNVLCPLNPTIEQDNIYMNVDAVTGKALATIFSGFTNAQGTSTASNQSVTISNFVIRTQ